MFILKVSALFTILLSFREGARPQKARKCSGMREYKSSNFEEVLEQMTMDLQEEFELA